MVAIQHGSLRFNPRAQPTGASGSNVWRHYAPTVVGLTTPTDTVVIGDTVMSGAEKFRVVGDALINGNVTADRAFLGNAAAQFFFGNEPLIVAESQVGSAVAYASTYIEQFQPSGADTGSRYGQFIVVISDTNSSSTAGYIAEQTLVGHGGTGTNSALFGHLSQAGINPTVAAAIGTVTDAYSYYTISDAMGFTGGSSSSFTRMTGLYVQAPFADATHTIGTMRGIVVENMGKTGVTNAVGIDILAQSGAATTNLGLRTAAVVQFGATFMEWLTAIAAPAAPASGFRFYIDAADGIWKAKSAGGVVTPLALP